MLLFSSSKEAVSPISRWISNPCTAFEKGQLLLLKMLQIGGEKEHSQGASSQFRGLREKWCRKG